MEKSNFYDWIIYFISIAILSGCSTEQNNFTEKELYCRQLTNSNH